MRMLIKNILILSLLLFYVTIAMGQNISEKLCNQVFDSVAQSSTPVKVYRRNVYSSDCDYEFTSIKKINVLISIEAYKTEGESHRSLIEQINPSTNFQIPNKLKLNKVWDEAYIYKSKRRTESFILLRKGRLIISLFSLQADAIIELENVIRNTDLTE